MQLRVCEMKKVRKEIAFVSDYMSKESFYNKISNELVVDDEKLFALIDGETQNESGFYELCCYFADAVAKKDVGHEKIVSELRSHFREFCERNHCSLSKALFSAVRDCYYILLPHENEDGTPPRGLWLTEERWRGGEIAVFAYPAVLSSKIWQDVFGDVMY